MTSFLRSTHLLLIIACVCFALVGGPVTHSQATTAAAQQKQGDQSASLNVNLYKKFLTVVGEENDTIKSEIESGETPVTQRRNYVAILGISKNEEQTMLAILIDAFHQRQAIEEERKGTCYDYFARFDRAKAGKMCHEEYLTYVDKQQATLEKAVTKLQEELGEEAFGKLTAYLKSGKFDRYAYVGGIAVDRKNIPDPCPPNNNPPAGQTTHRGCARLYESEVLDRVAWVDEQNRLAAKKGESENKNPTRFTLFDDLQEDKREVAIDISREAYRKINENERKYYPAASRFYDECVVKYGAEKAKEMPLPLELQALKVQRPLITEEYILRLRQEVGEDFFNQLDKYLGDLNRSTQPINSLPPAQLTPAVQQ
jgi:hypothetical protein